MALTTNLGLLVLVQSKIHQTYWKSDISQRNTNNICSLLCILFSLLMYEFILYGGFQCYCLHMSLIQSIYNLIHKYKIILASPCVQKGSRVAQLIKIL